MGYLGNLLNLTAALMAEGGLPALLTSGTAIVVYIFIILTAIAALVVVILAGDRERKPSSPVGGWMKHKLESRFQEEISVMSDMHMTPP